MKRVFTMEEWDERGRRMEEVAARFQLSIKRPPIDEQTRKSPEKRALLKRMYGDTGQP